MKYQQMIRNTKLAVLLVWAMLLSCTMLLSSCTAENEYDRSYPCYFFFDTSIHNVSIIKNATNPLAPGIFVLISQDQKNGVRYINAELNDGSLKEQTPITTAKELQANLVIGTYNGIIVGYSALGNGLYAFDRQCPNCLKQYGLYKYPLTWNKTTNTWVDCNNCNRSYDLNNNGYVVKGEQGSKLIKYYIMYNGETLIVHN